MATTSVSQMRDYIAKQYKDSEKWAARVKHFPDNQVIAIYKRMIEKKDKPAPPLPEFTEGPYIYSCSKCGSYYIRDNPDLEECEVCFTKIKKEESL